MYLRPTGEISYSDGTRILESMKSKCKRPILRSNLVGRTEKRKQYLLIFSSEGMSSLA